MSPSQRLQWGLGVLTVLPFLSFFNFFWQNAPQETKKNDTILSRFVSHPKDDWAVHSETRFAPVRAFLPRRGIVGLISDKPDTLFAVRLYGAQNTLSPLILVPSAQASLVLCVFQDPTTVREAQQKRGLWQWTEIDPTRDTVKNSFIVPGTRFVHSQKPLLLLHDFGGGLMLFRNGAHVKSDSGSRDQRRDQL